VTASATDLAWFYLNASRALRNADASALAGVVWMPGDFYQASATAQDVAKRNGFDEAAPNVTVIPSLGG